MGVRGDGEGVCHVSYFISESGDVIIDGVADEDGFAGFFDRSGHVENGADEAGDVVE